MATWKSGDRVTTAARAPLAGMVMSSLCNEGRYWVHWPDPVGPQLEGGADLYLADSSPATRQARPDFRAIKADLAALCERHGLPVACLLFVGGRMLYSRAAWATAAYNKAAVEELTTGLKVYLANNKALVNKILQARHKAEQLTLSGSFGEPRVVTEPDPNEVPDEQLPEQEGFEPDAR